MTESKGRANDFGKCTWCPRRFLEHTRFPHTEGVIPATGFLGRTSEALRSSTARTQTEHRYCADWPVVRWLSCVCFLVYHFDQCLLPNGGRLLVLIDDHIECVTYQHFRICVAVFQHQFRVSCFAFLEFVESTHELTIVNFGI